MSLSLKCFFYKISVFLPEVGIFFHSVSYLCDMKPYFTCLKRLSQSCALFEIGIIKQLSSFIFGKCQKILASMFLQSAFLYKQTCVLAVFFFSGNLCLLILISSIIEKRKQCPSKGISRFSNFPIVRGIYFRGFENFSTYLTSQIFFFNSSLFAALLGWCRRLSSL